MQDEDRAPDTFYKSQYARFGGALAAEIRREVYGADLGQQGWRTLGEQEQIAELVRAQASCHLMDVACGSGGPALAVSAVTGCRLTGVDIEQAAIAEAQERASLAGDAGARFAVADCNLPLPFEDAGFDVITCVDAVLHLRNRNSAFADWYRLLRPGGSLLLTDAAVLTGQVGKSELDIRASQGDFALVPAGINEGALELAGFVVRHVEDTSAATARIAQQLLDARVAREEALEVEEGKVWFARRQSFLRITATLAGEGRLSRFLYIANKK